MLYVAAVLCWAYIALMHMLADAVPLSNWTQGIAVATPSAASSHQGGAAFSSSNSALQGLPMSGCGTCWEVQCISAAGQQDFCSSTLGNATVIVNMVGWCSSCQLNEVVLDPGLVELLATMPAPLVMYRQVECQPPDAVEIAVNEYSTNSSKVSLHLNKVAGTGNLQAVQIGHADQGDNDAWLGMENSHGAIWTGTVAYFDSAPFDVRATDASGKTIVIRQAIPFHGFVGSVQTNMQFASTKLAQSTDPAALDNSYAISPGPADTVPISPVPPAAIAHPVPASSALASAAAHAPSNSAYNGKPNFVRHTDPKASPPLLSLKPSASISSNAKPPSSTTNMQTHRAHANQPSLAPTSSESPQAGLLRLGSAPRQHVGPSAGAPGPASDGVAGPAAAPGNAQSQNIVQEDPGKDHLPVIVLGALLGAVTIALLAGLCLVLALGVLGRRRKLILSDEQTHSASSIRERQTATEVHRADPMFYLQDSFGAVNWKQNATFAESSIEQTMRSPIQTCNYRSLACGTAAHADRYNEAYEPGEVAVHHAETSAGSYRIPTSSRLKQIASSITSAKADAAGVAILEIQRLDTRPGGLLNLRLRQKAGDILLQSLLVRQSSEGKLRRGWTPLSRVNASTWHLESFFLKPPFDLCVQGSLGEELTLRRVIVQGQATDIVIRLMPGRAVLREQDDVLSQQPLAASPHFFSLKAPNPAWHEIQPVPSKTSPVASVHPKARARAHVLDSWPSSTTLDANDALHGDLSSTWSSVQQYALADKTSPAHIPTPDGMDMRPTKSMSRVFVQEQKTSIRSQRLDFPEDTTYVPSITKKPVPMRKPVLTISELMQHFPSMHQGLFLTDASSICESDFSESASSLELNLPSTFGPQSLTRFNSLFKAKKNGIGHDWRAEQLAGSCIPQPSAARGQYANWACPPDVLMGSAFSFQSELLETYTPSVHSGAYSAVSAAAQGTNIMTRAGNGAIRDNLLFEDAQSEAESTDTWPFDNMSVHAPTALQHKHPSPGVVHSASVASAEHKVNMLEIADSAWETLHQEQHMRRFSNSSGSTTCDTCFIRHVGDKLFDNIVK